MVFGKRLVCIYALARTAQAFHKHCCAGTRPELSVQPLMFPTRSTLSGHQQHADCHQHRHQLDTIPSMP
jgi:hypothetical protein